MAKGTEGRVTNRDLLEVVQTVNRRLDAQTARLDAMVAHFDSGLGRLGGEVAELRRVTNARLHEFEGRLVPLERGWDLRVALLRGSWKLTTALLMAAGIISGLLARYGPPWEWVR